MKYIFTLLIFTFCNGALASKELPELKVREIEENVFLHTSFENVEGFGLVASKGLVFIDNNDAYLIDTPTSAKDTQKLTRWIKERGYSLKASISTHFHSDSSGGIEWLNTHSIPTYASELTNKLLVENKKPQATNTFKGNSFWLLKDKIEIFYPGAGHTQDNVVVWLAGENILFGGCFVKAKYLGYLGDAVLEEWPASTKLLISRYPQAKLVVAGHGPTGDMSLLVKTHALSLKKLNSLNKMASPEEGHTH